MNWWQIWATWFVIVALSFVALEIWAMTTPGGLTATQFLMEMSKTWRLATFVAGSIVGGMVVHILGL